MKEHVIDGNICVYPIRYSGLVNNTLTVVHPFRKRLPCPLKYFLLNKSYSCFSAVTGLASEALSDSYPTVTMVIITIKPIAPAKTTNDKLV